jgi:uncharacterized protein (DUF433 family)
MSELIINRGRGPEIAGTRITVYCIMDYVREGIDARQIAAELRLSAAQVASAIEYIHAHEAELAEAYEQIVNRDRSNPARVEAGRAKSIEELQQRLLARRAKSAAHADRQ